MEELTLQVLTRKEAAVKGLLFSTKIKHEILDLIDAHTSVSRARNRRLLTIDELSSMLEEKFRPNMPAKAIVELKLDKLIGLLPGLRYNGQSLVPVAYLVSRPQDSSLDIDKLYDALVESSVDSLRTYLFENGSFHKDQFWKDLESSLMEDSSTDVFYPNIYFEPRLIFHSLELPVAIDQELVGTFCEDLLEEVVEQRAGILLENSKVFVFSEGSLMEIGLTLQTFFGNRILPYYADKAVVRRELEIIRLQEELYKKEFPDKKSFTFVAARARAVLKYLKEEQGGDQEMLPGQLVLSMVSQLETRVNEGFEKEYLEQTYVQYAEFKEKLDVDSIDWRDIILFIESREMKKYPEAVLEKLVKDKSILHTTWYTRKEKFHVFMGLEPGNFSLVLQGIGGVGNSEAWKILAYRKLLEDATRIPAAINPFQDSRFYSVYGRLLRAAYAQYLPMVLNLITMLNIDFINRMIYKTVKRYVSEKQKSYRIKHNEICEQERRVFLAEKNRYQSDIKRLAVRNRILEELDFFYFSQNLIPSVQDIQARFPATSESQLKELIKEYAFEIIPVSASSSWGDSIVYYPKSSSWPHLTARTKAKMKDAYEEQLAISRYHDQDSVVLRRMRALGNFIGFKPA